MQNKIVVIGSSNVDMVMKMDHLPVKGETVTDAEFIQVFGGKGANQAVGAARAGGDVAFVNCVGNDAYAPLMIENFSRDGINTEYIFQEEGISSGSALIMIGAGGDNYLSVAPGANYRLTPHYIDRCGHLIDGAEVILLQYEIPADTLAYAIRKAHATKARVIWNFAPAREIDRSLLPMVDILVVNEVEASFLTGRDVNTLEDIARAAADLKDKGIHTVIITLGSDGSYIVSEGYQEKIPAFCVEALDSTAAGDIYCGSLAVAITEGRSLTEAVTFASAASALSVMKIGAQPSAPTRKEIDEFLLKNQ